MGQKIYEENEIYKTGVKLDGSYTWKGTDGERTEIQMYEDFTFGVLKSNIGINLLSQESENLMEDVPFKSYEIEFKREFSLAKKKNKWMTYVLFFIVFIIWQIIRRMYGIL